MSALHGSDPFVDVGSLFPGDVEPISVRPSTTVAEALRVMKERRFSQLPVTEEDGRLRGVFSLWSLAHQILESPRLRPHDLAVEDVMEQLPSVSVEDPLEAVLDHFQRADAAIVRSAHGLQAVATPTDALNYYARVAGPFVLLQEIELALRALIEGSLSEVEIKECADRALASKYKDAIKGVPGRLVDMSMEDYRNLVTARRNWPHFDGLIGRNRDLVVAKLERVVAIRNKVFHFRDPISVSEHQTLAGTRNWLFDKARAMREKRRESGQP